MLYPDGSEIQVGDLVWWNEGSCLGFICRVIESPEDIAYWDFAMEGEAGVLIGTGHPFDPDSGSLIHPASIFADEGIGKLSPEESAEFNRACSLAWERSRIGFDSRPWDVQPEIRDGALFAWVFSIFSPDKRENARQELLETITILHSEAS